MKIVIALPWRPSPGRMAAFNYVRAHLARVLPYATIIEVDTPHEPYNLAAVRNECVRQAEVEGADVVVLSDADCVICPDEFLHAAIAGAFNDGLVHMPFVNQMYLDEQQSASFMESGTIALGGHLGNGACYVMSPAAYWRCGGSDERFSGWGGDDDQFVACADTLVGLVRHEGTAVSLWHPAVRDVGSERWQPNSRLAVRYGNARGNTHAIRLLIAERTA